ncbi:MAG TPA: hypothetical protein PLL10_10715, partial [Elusimicrobiales bacterium]|nr:hypothetical protein [Elusimicrobiales bacterium]
MKRAECEWRPLAELIESLGAVHTLHFLIYPEQGGVFDGKDVHDQWQPEWTFPGSQIPRDILHKWGLALLVDPERVEEVQLKSGNRIVVHAKKDGIAVVERLALSGISWITNWAAHEFGQRPQDG